MRSVGERIRFVRRTREPMITQQELAEKAAVDRSLIAKLEGGVSDGSLQTLRKIAAALGISLAELLEEPTPYGERNDRPESGQAALHRM
ncbi:MAG: helix-turn-helix transcriptional regulator [Negativicutes bacterium]|nr:helix-turn-helix transcriptional regulator [Negativicutes bacterium]